MTKVNRSDKNTVGKDMGQDENILRFSDVILQGILKQSNYCHKANQYKSIDINEVYITLFASAPDQKQHCLKGETVSRGVLDSGCTKTVSRELKNGGILKCLT